MASKLQHEHPSEFFICIPIDSPTLTSLLWNPTWDPVDWNPLQILHSEMDTSIVPLMEEQLSTILQHILRSSTSITPSKLRSLCQSLGGMYQVMAHLLLIKTLESEGMVVIGTYLLLCFGTWTNFIIDRSPQPSWGWGSLSGHPRWHPQHGHLQCWSNTWQCGWYKHQRLHYPTSDWWHYWNCQHPHQPTPHWQHYNA